MPAKSNECTWQPNGATCAIHRAVYIPIKDQLSVKYTIKKCCSVFFYPNAGFSVLCHFIGLFFYPSAGFSLLGHFIGLFFLIPNHWVEPVSSETSQRSCCEHRLFKSTGDSGSQRQRFGELFRGNKGL